MQPPPASLPTRPKQHTMAGLCTHFMRNQPCDADPRPSHPLWCAAPPPNATGFTTAQLEHFFFNRGLTRLDVNRGRVRLLGPPAFDDAEPENVGFLYTASLPVYGSCVVQSSLSPATRDRYQAWVNEWSQHCQRAGVPPLPVDPYALALWVELLISAYAGSSVNVALSAVITWSKLNNYPNPVVVHPMLELLRQGLRRTFLRRTKPQPLAITADIVLQLFLRYWRLHGDDPTADIQYTRFMAMLLTAVEIGPRPSEELKLSMCSYLPLADASGATLLIIDTKNNFHQRGTLACASVANAYVPLETCPSAYAFLEEVWLPLLALLGIQRHPLCNTNRDSLYTCRLCPPLFPTLPANRPPGRVGRTHLASMLHLYLTLGQVPDVRRYTPTSLRSGCASIAAAQRVPSNVIQQHLRWSGEGTQAVYTDQPAADKLAVSRAIHQAYHAGSAEPYADYDDECHVCREPGLLLLCDGTNCTLAAHPACVGLQGAPTDDWLCDACRGPWQYRHHRIATSTNLPQQ